MGAERNVTIQFVVVLMAASQIVVVWLVSSILMSHVIGLGSRQIHVFCQIHVFPQIHVFHHIHMFSMDMTWGGTRGGRAKPWMSVSVIDVRTTSWRRSLFTDSSIFPSMLLPG